MDRGTRRPAIEPRNQPRLGCRRRRVRRKATSLVALDASHREPHAVEEPVHARNLHAREPGDPIVARPPDQRSGRPGKAMAASLGRTTWGVVQPRSTCEAPNKAVRGGTAQARTAAEAMEERGLAEGNTDQRNGCSDSEPKQARQVCAGPCAPRRVTGRGVKDAHGGDISRDHGRMLPKPKTTSDPRQEPSAVVPHAGICAGGRPKGRSLPQSRCCSSPLPPTTRWCRVSRRPGRSPTRP